jgi:S-adenosylmethionine:tRNA ribosyltransferase-isomerase
MTAELAHPQLLEAQAPPERRGIERDGVRLLVTDRASGMHTHAGFSELATFLRSGDLLVVNDSATVPAALLARRSNGESLVLHVATMIDHRIWMVEPRGPVVLGEELRLPDGGSAVIIAPVEPEQPRVWYAWFQTPLPMYEYLMRVGEPIRYGYVTQRFPLEDYQTMFARVPGSSEMPSAARPFTPRVVQMLAQRGVEIATITLHCSVASFERPERPASERFVVSRATAEAVSAAHCEGRRVVAVGTTVVRALESAVTNGIAGASSGWTDLVIDDRHRVRSVDGLLSGFHDTNATHMSMLQAFLSRATLEDAYAEAAEHGYHRHEFGDVHLIL